MEPDGQRQLEKWLFLPITLHNKDKKLSSRDRVNFFIFVILLMRKVCLKTRWVCIFIFIITNRTHSFRIYLFN